MCLREVSSRRYVSSRKLSAGCVFAFACPRVFATQRAFARHVYMSSGSVFACQRVFATPRSSPDLSWGACLPPPARDVLTQGSVLVKCVLTPTSLRDTTCLRLESVFRHPRVFTWHVSADAQVSSQITLGSLSPRRLQWPLCLVRRQQQT